MTAPYAVRRDLPGDDVPDRLPHDSECEVGKVVISPATRRPYTRETCDCRGRRTDRSRQLKEQPLYLSWLHGSSGVVPSP